MTKQIQTVGLEQFLQTFRDSFVKNENGFEVVQAYDVEEYERFLTDFYRQAQQEAVEMERERLQPAVEIAEAIADLRALKSKRIAPEIGKRRKNARRV